MQVSSGGDARMAEPFTGEDEQTPEARIASVFSVAAVGRAVGDLAATGNSTHQSTTAFERCADTPVSEASA